MAENDFLSGLLGGVKDAGSSIYGGISGLLGGGEQTPAAGGQMQDSMSMLSPADQKRLMFSTLGELGGVLLAAGARQSPESRAQALAKLGSVGGNVQTQAYNIAQANLMRQQLLEKQQMLESQKQLGELAKDPEAYKARFGYDPTGIAGSQLMGINQQIVAQSATNPYAQETALTQLQANQQTLAQASEKKSAIDAILARPDVPQNVKDAIRLDPSLAAKVLVPEAQKPGAAVEQYNLYRAQELAGNRVPLSFFDYETALKKAGQTTINVGDTAAKVIATGAAKMAEDQLAAGQTAAINLAGSNTIRSLLDEGAITGFGAEGKVLVGSALQNLGITPEDPRVSNSRLLMSQLANRSLDAAGRMKGQGAITEPERKLLQEAAGSNIALGEGTIRRVLDITDRVDQAALKQGIVAAEVLAGTEGIKGTPLERLYPKPAEPKPYTRSATFQGQPITAKLGVDGRYYATVNGQRLVLPEE
jgi:hypothetical protein